MNKVAIWCRHYGDDIIGIGSSIPWTISSDLRRFRDLTKGQTLLVGKNTYESFPNRTLPNRRFLVLAEADYKVSDETNHQVITGLEPVNSYSDDVYIAGGASVYNYCFSMPEYRPDIVVDCVYHGDVTPGLQGTPVSVHPSVEVLQKEYQKLTPEYELDNVFTAIWVKKGFDLHTPLLLKILDYMKKQGENNATIS